MSDAAASGVAALGALNAGTLKIEDRTITLNGIAENPEAAGKADAALAALPQGYVFELSLKLLDDGKPAELALVYDAASGGALSGKAPAGLTADRLADLLGLSELDVDIGASNQGGADAISTNFAALARWLPMFEQLQATVTADGVAVSGALTPGSDRELMEEALGEAFGVGSITLSELANPPGEWPREQTRRRASAKIPKRLLAALR